MQPSSGIAAEEYAHEGYGRVHYGSKSSVPSFNNTPARKALPAVLAPTWAAYAREGYGRVHHSQQRAAAADPMRQAAIR